MAQTSLRLSTANFGDFPPSPFPSPGFPSSPEHSPIQSPASSSSLSLSSSPNSFPTLCQQDWPICDSTEPPIFTQSGAVRARFLREEWIPYLHRLRSELRLSSERRVLGCSLDESLTSQDRIAFLSQSCAQLTLRYYGKPNYSAFYEFFIELNRICGAHPYSLEDVATSWSNDGYVFLFNGAHRNALYAPGAKSESRDSAMPSLFEFAWPDEVQERAKQPNRLHLISSQGTIRHDVGASMIDNTVLPNVFSPFEAKVLLVGEKLKIFCLAMLRTRQQRWLRIISTRLRTDECKLLPPTAAVLARKFLKQTASPSEIRALLSILLETGAIDAWGVATGSLSFRLLHFGGWVVRSWGQLPAAVKRVWHSFLTAAIADLQPAASASTSTNERRVMKAIESALPPHLRGKTSWEIFHEFVCHIRNQPGQMFGDSAELHAKLLMTGVLANRLNVVQRSFIEKKTESRFFTIRWQRQVPLLGCTEALGKRQLTEVRAVGVDEVSVLRNNKFPYLPSHGMGLSGSGLNERRGSEHFQIGAALPTDGGAKLPNWSLIDIEKVLVEAEALNPLIEQQASISAGPLPTTCYTQCLPGEGVHDVTQNCRSGSSIGKTQHTQVARGGVLGSPLAGVRCAPCWYEELGCTIDLIQLGVHSDAFFLRFETRQPTYKPLLELLVDLRSHLLLEFGSETIDFMCWCGGSETGWYSILFAPVVFSPDIIKQRRAESGFPFDVGLGASVIKGHIGCSIPNDLHLAFCQEQGLDAIAAIFDFSRLVSSRSRTSSFLLRRIGFIDDHHEKIVATARSKLDIKAATPKPSFFALEVSTQ